MIENIKLYQKEYQKNYREKNKEEIKSKRKNDKEYNINARLKNKYSLTVNEVIEILQSQDNKCSNKQCGKDLPFPDRATHIDHNHETGKIRGILCHNCNVAAGFLKDDIKIIRGLADYLESHE